MSRRRTSNSHHAYGAVRLVCRDGHPLGLVLKQPDGRYFISPGLQRIDSADGVRTKIKAKCEQCEAAGQRRDLQVSWDGRLLPMLDELEADPTASVLELVIG